MRTLESVTADLRALGDEKYRPFNERIANIRPGSSLGVRMPQLRTYAKALVREEGFSLQELFLFPNDICFFSVLTGCSVWVGPRSMELLRLPFGLCMVSSSVIGSRPP